MIAARRFSTFSPVHTTNFLPGVDEPSFVGCGKCVDLRVMGLVLGALLKLPPAKQILASDQVRSRYLEYIYSRIR